MADSKLEFKVGSISFTGEGDGDWLAKQLDKMLAKIPELVAVAPAETVEGKISSPASKGGSQVSGALAVHLKNTNATTNQSRKFLSAAVWLHDTKSMARLSTSDVSAALSASSQSRLANASECLNRNVAAGHCEKDGKQFYVTPEGRASLGL